MGPWLWRGSVLLVGFGEAGERRGPDGKVLPSSLASLHRRGLSENMTRASPSSWAKAELKNLRDRGKSHSLA